MAEPMRGWVQTEDGRWVPPGSTPPSDEQTMLLRKMASDLAQVRGCVVLVTLLYLISLVIVLAMVSGA